MSQEQFHDIGRELQLNNLSDPNSLYKTINREHRGASFLVQTAIASLEEDGLSLSPSLLQIVFDRNSETLSSLGEVVGSEFVDYYNPWVQLAGKPRFGGRGRPRPGNPEDSKEYSKWKLELKASIVRRTGVHYLMLKSELLGVPLKELLGADNPLELSQFNAASREISLAKSDGMTEKIRNFFAIDNNRVVLTKENLKYMVNSVVLLKEDVEAFSDKKRMAGKQAGLGYRLNDVVKLYRDLSILSISSEDSLTKLAKRIAEGVELAISGTDEDIRIKDGVVDSETPRRPRRRLPKLDIQAGIRRHPHMAAALVTTAVFTVIGGAVWFGDVSPARGAGFNESPGIGDTRMQPNYNSTPDYTVEEMISRLDQDGDMIDDRIENCNDGVVDVNDGLCGLIEPSQIIILRSDVAAGKPTDIDDIKERLAFLNDIATHLESELEGDSDNNSLERDGPKLEIERKDILWVTGGMGLTANRPFTLEELERIAKDPYILYIGPAFKYKPIVDDGANNNESSILGAFDNYQYPHLMFLPLVGQGYSDKTGFSASGQEENVSNGLQQLGIGPKIWNESARIFSGRQVEALNGGDFVVASCDTGMNDVSAVMDEAGNSRIIAKLDALRGGAWGEASDNYYFRGRHTGHGTVTGVYAYGGVVEREDGQKVHLGVAPNTRIVAIKMVPGSTNAAVIGIQEGIVSWNTAHSEQDRIRVATNAWGINTWGQPFEDIPLIMAIRAADETVFAFASGNDGYPEYPGAWFNEDGVLTNGFSTGNMWLRSPIPGSAWGITPYGWFAPTFYAPGGKSNWHTVVSQDAEGNVGEIFGGTSASSGGAGGLAVLEAQILEHLMGHIPTPEDVVASLRWGAAVPMSSGFPEKRPNVQTGTGSLFAPQMIEFAQALRGVDFASPVGYVRFNVQPTVVGEDDQIIHPDIDVGLRVSGRREDSGSGRFSSDWRTTGNELLIGFPAGSSIFDLSIPEEDWYPVPPPSSRVDVVGGASIEIDVTAIRVPRP